ncbi:MAG: prolyl oligopeptidase family serine peptidase [Phycisphaerales bacterium]
MIVDPADRIRWVDAQTLWLVPSAEAKPIVAVDAATGARREIPRDQASASLSRGLEQRPRRTRGQGASSALIFLNQTPGPVKLEWIDAGGRAHEYGQVAPGATRRQQTYGGHAWRVSAADGTVLGYAVGDEVPVEVRIAAASAPATDASSAARDAAAATPSGGAPALSPAPPPEPPLPAAAAKLEGPALWSPDRAHVVVFERTPAQRHPVTIVESSPRDQVQPKVRVIDYLKPGDQIEQRWPRLFAADGTERALDRSLFANPWSIGDFRWSADGRTFWFTYNQRGHQAMRLLAVDAATGAVRAVVDERPATFFDYAHKFFLHWFGDAEFLWMSERDGWNHLYLIDAATGQVKRQVTQGPWMVRSVERVDDARRELLLRTMGERPGEDPYHMHFVRVPIDGGAPVRLTEGDGTHRLEWSPGGEWYVDTWSRVDLPPVHELRRAADGSLVCELGRADASALLAAGWRMPERFVAKGRDGATDIWGAIWRPMGELPATLPVLEQIYAGPQDFHTPKSFEVWTGRQGMAQEGFVVVQMDGMGTNWRGKAFHDVAWKNLRDAGLPDRVAWLRAAGAKHPEMDLTRVGIYGGSAGGQNAMRALLDFPEVYRVGVADCGCHDNRMDKIWWNELWMGWPVDESYERSSNVVDAAKLQGKLMLVVGELDENVDPASTMQVAAALQRAGTDFELVVVAGQGHGAAESPFGSRKRLEFLKRHLQGGDARGGASTGTP